MLIVKLIYFNKLTLDKQKIGVTLARFVIEY